MFISDCLKPHTLSGPICGEYIVRFYWNHKEKKCERTIYGGCRATRNNFATMDICQEVAGTICSQSWTRTPTCTMILDKNKINEFGYIFLNI